MAKSGISIQVDATKLQQLHNRTPRMVEELLSEVAEEMVTEMKLSMTNSPASGRSYKRGSRVHVASSPDNPPRPDLGSLIGSLRWVLNGKGSRRIEDGVQHGILMEIGTENIEPRPFMRPVFEMFRASRLAEMVKARFGF